MDATIEARARRAIGERVFPGCVIAVVTPKGGRMLRAFGCHAYDPDSPVVTKDTLYDLASITKSVPTATLVLHLIDEGALRLDEALAAYIPEYRNSEVTIRHLLTYTASGLQLSTLKDATPEELITAALSSPLTHPAGEHFAYTNLPAFLLGLALECLLGPLDQAAEEKIFKPFDMTATTFKPHGAAPTEEGIQDIVHDESARVFSLAPLEAKGSLMGRAHRVVGHAGLFSTAPDLLKFLEHLLENPDKRLSTNYLADISASASLGWELNQAHFMGRFRSPQTFGKTGFTGTSIVCDYERKAAIIILSNRTYPKRPEDASAINRFRSDISDIVFQSP